MIKLIVALGNPGSRYELTRHNAGWLWLDGKFSASGYQFDKYGNYEYKISSLPLDLLPVALLESGRHYSLKSDEPNLKSVELAAVRTDCILVKPQTFMNESGLSVKYALKQFNVTLDQLLVVHDEVDLEIGESKISCNRGDGGHNGIRSIVNQVGSKDFCRLRLGVRPAEVAPSVKADTYVLNRFREPELQSLLAINL